jgi:hypothetical protein
VSLCTPERHAGGMEVRFDAFLIFSLDWVSGQLHYPDLFTAGEGPDLTVLCAPSMSTVGLLIIWSCNVINFLFVYNSALVCVLALQFHRSRYSDLLRAGRFGVWNPVGEWFSALGHTGREAHPASCKMGPGFFLGVKRPECGVDSPLPYKEKVELYRY